MKLAVDANNREAMSPEGYRLTWAKNKHGTWFSGYAPNGRCVEASYDREKVERALDEHLGTRMKVAV